MTEATRRRLLEPGFRYVRAAETDIRATLNRARAELAAKHQNNVKPLKHKEPRHG